MEADEEEPAIVAGDARAMSLLEDEPSDGSSESVRIQIFIIICC